MRAKLSRSQMVGLAAAVAALLLAIAAWIVVPADSVPLRRLPGGSAAALPARLLPLLGIAVAGLAAFAAWALTRRAPPGTSDAEDPSPAPAPPSSPPGAAPPAPPSPPRPEELTRLLAIPLAALALLLIVAVALAALDAPRAALILVCGTLALVSGGYALAAVRDGATIELNSHWGGLGGSLGGWRVSPVTTLLIVLAVALLAIAAAVGGGGGKGDDPDQPPAAAGKQAVGKEAGGKEPAQAAPAPAPSAGPAQNQIIPAAGNSGVAR